MKTKDSQSIYFYLFIVGERVIIIPLRPVSNLFGKVLEFGAGRLQQTYSVSRLSVLN